jgi:hypothetical protein
MPKHLSYRDDTEEIVVAVALHLRYLLLGGTPMMSCNAHNARRLAVERAARVTAAKNTRIDAYLADRLQASVDRCAACGADRGDGYCQECPDDPDRADAAGAQPAPCGFCKRICGFCKDRPVVDASSWVGGPEKYAACPRCGVRRTP